MKLDEHGSVLVVEVLCENETVAVGQALAQVLEPGTVIGLVGPLGAGKTRLVRAIAEALGADPAAIASPTFVLIHEYEAKLPIFHFDVYRLTSPCQFEALGPADYFASPGICLIEWADRVLHLLPPTAWLISIESTGEISRRLTICLGDRTGALRRLAEQLGRLSI